ncbi:hypothetical protein [Paramagnetospirillum kuznetsovii]|uniref:hypothetical protein n=1 Tax=Paramagnetospirillum kuznetsovii TaxID=2053833 RepID=UPI001375005A|nr:hypothetical protein [Paramagnetospirillum kuznetsovii]
MASVITKTGPWNMTVYTYESGDAENPLGRLDDRDITLIPFGAVELSAEGTVLGHNDTEPDLGGGARAPIVGRDFFTDVAGWARGSAIADEFKKGVANGELNVVFDCAHARLPYRVRLHLKVSPILGTYWAFIKRLQRAS